MKGRLKDLKEKEQADGKVIEKKEVEEDMRGISFSVYDFLNIYFLIILVFYCFSIHEVCILLCYTEIEGSLDFSTI